MHISSGIRKCKHTLIPENAFTNGITANGIAEYAARFCGLLVISAHIVAPVTINVARLVA